MDVACRTVLYGTFLCMCALSWQCARTCKCTAAVRYAPWRRHSTDPDLYVYNYRNPDATAPALAHAQLLAASSSSGVLITFDDQGGGKAYDPVPSSNGFNLDGFQLLSCHQSYPFACTSRQFFAMCEDCYITHPQGSAFDVVSLWLSSK